MLELILVRWRADQYLMNFHCIKILFSTCSQTGTVYFTSDNPQSGLFCFCAHGQRCDVLYGYKQNERFIGCERLTLAFKSHRSTERLLGQGGATSWRVGLTVHYRTTYSDKHNNSYSHPHPRSFKSETLI